MRRVIPGAVDQLAPDDQFDLTQLDSDHASGSDSESSDRESSEFTVGGNPEEDVRARPFIGSDTESVDCAASGGAHSPSEQNDHWRVA